MIKSLINRAIKLPLLSNVIALAVTVFAFILIKSKLDEKYAASNHPVDYATGQTSFNGETIKGYYQTMIDAGTLDIYWQTQFIDFGFIVAIFCIGLFTGALVARFARVGSWGRKLGRFAAFAIIMGALCDVIENLISFVMLSNPVNFQSWIALPYSGFAVLKFLLITLGVLGVLASILMTLIGRLAQRPKIG